MGNNNAYFGKNGILSDGQVFNDIVEKLTNSSSNFNKIYPFVPFFSIVELFGDGNSSISVLRSFRLLRIFKLVRFLPALRRQLLVMIHTMDNVMTFLALLILFIFTASILGMNLFGGKYMFTNEDGEKSAARANFDDLFWALVTVFQVSHFTTKNSNFTTKSFVDPKTDRMLRFSQSPPSFRDFCSILLSIIFVYVDKSLF